MRELNRQETQKVIDILVKETPNPSNHYDGLEWFEKTVDLNSITIDPHYIQQRLGPNEHFFTRLKEDIEANGLKEPLIVTYDNLFLADGYKRYQVLKRLREKSVPVYHGIYLDKRVIWDMEARCFIKLG